MKSGRVVAVFLLLPILIAVLPIDKVSAFPSDTLYFSGGSISSSAALINSEGHPYYPNTVGERESEVYPFESFLTIDPFGSAGYVMPSKPNNGTYAIPVDDGGGAVGAIALGIVGEEKTSNTVEYNQSRKQKFYNFLKLKNQSGSKWEKMGSAHIVHQMLGHSSPWGESGRTITASQWDDFYNRLVENPQIWMVYASRQSVPKNTAAIQMGSGANPQIDVIDDSNPYLAAIWAFRSGSSPESGTTVYNLEIICANPVGDLEGLPSYAPDPPKSYSLVPIIDKISGNVIEPGGRTTVEGSITNESSGTDARDSEDTIWQLVRFVFGPGKNLANADKAGGTGDSAPCDVTFAHNPASCKLISEGTGVYKADSKVNLPKGEYVAETDIEFGSEVCFMLSVSRPTQESTPVWRYSSLRCLGIVKQPKMQVLGGDVRVEGAIDTSISTFSSKTYGSWGEYAAISRGLNKGFASGAGLAGGSGSSLQSDWKSLTFANAGGQYGLYEYTSSAPGLIGQFSGLSGTSRSGTTSLSDLSSGVYIYNTGNLKLTASNIRAGVSVIINATGTVTIAGNINYHNGPYTSVYDIPQVIIRAPSINIESAVSNVDAWLIATKTDRGGTLNTCSDVAGNLSSKVCNMPLTVHGPVVTDRIILRRTAGSEGAGDSLGSPAETFNLRADAFLWGSAYSNKNAGSGVRSVYTTELPPRL